MSEIIFNCSVGCSSFDKYYPNKAPIWPIASVDDARQLASTGFHFIAIVNYVDFSSELADVLTSKPLNCEGIVLLKDSTYFTSTGKSSDVESPQGKQTPQAEYTDSATYPWNGNAGSILWRDFPFPIALSVEGIGEVERFVNGAALNKKLGFGGGFATAYVLAEMSTYMGKDKSMNSVKCLQLGGSDIESTTVYINVTHVSEEDITRHLSVPLLHYLVLIVLYIYLYIDPNDLPRVP
jgi:hypothetical protein